MAKSAKSSRADADRTIRETQKEFEKRIDAIRTELKEKSPEMVEKSLNDLKAGFEDRFGDMLETIENAHESLDSAREGLGNAVEKGRTTIQERPLMAVGVALAAGVALGLIFGRRSRGD